MGNAFHKENLKLDKNLRSPSLHLSSSLIEEVDLIAKEHKMTPSNVIRLMIRLEHEAFETKKRMLEDDQKTA